MNGVSLVMATLGRTSEIGHFVDRLAEQSFVNYELIVVDQNGDARLMPVVEHAKAKGIRVRHVRQQTPNLCRARNAGIELATHEVVGFPDDDCWYEPITLELVTRRFSLSDGPDGVVIRWSEQDPKGHPPHILSDDAFRSFREIDASSIALFYKTSLLRSLNGFDERLGLHSWYGGAEETDLMLRVMALGARVAYEPEACVHHSFGPPDSISPGVAFARARRRARGTGALYAKHGIKATVVSRGVIAPLMRSLRDCLRPTHAAVQLGTFLGRVEGMIAWRFRR